MLLIVYFVLASIIDKIRYFLLLKILRNFWPETGWRTLLLVGSCQRVLSLLMLRCIFVAALFGIMIITLELTSILLLLQVTQAKLIVLVFRVGPFACLLVQLSLFGRTLLVCCEFICIPVFLALSETCVGLRFIDTPLAFVVRKRATTLICGNLCSWAELLGVGHIAHLSCLHQKPLSRGHSSVIMVFSNASATTFNVLLIGAHFTGWLGLLCRFLSPSKWPQSFFSLLSFSSESLTDSEASIERLNHNCGANLDPSLLGLFFA